MASYPLVDIPQPWGVLHIGARASSSAWMTSRHHAIGLRPRLTEGCSAEGPRIRTADRGRLITLSGPRTKGGAKGSLTQRPSCHQSFQSHIAHQLEEGPRNGTRQCQ